MVGPASTSSVVSTPTTSTPRTTLAFLPHQRPRLVRTEARSDGVGSMLLAIAVVLIRGPPSSPGIPRHHVESKGSSTPMVATAYSILYGSYSRCGLSLESLNNERHRQQGVTLRTVTAPPRLPPWSAQR